MANLCGANEALDNALSKLGDLKSDILGKLELPASEIAASLNNKLTELKSALDGLAIDLPSLPDVNLQAEITGAISDIDQTTIQGKIAFASKLAKLKLDFGDTVTELGLDLDKLIVSGTSLISGGGDICALIPNLDISAANSGTGVTTEEIVERSSTANLTLTQTPKEILSVQGKKTGTNFFSNINYKQTGLVIFPNELGNSEIKVTYLISLIKQKPVNSKQADKKEEQETAPIVVTNASAVDTKTLSSFYSLLTKYKTKSVLGLATDKEKAGYETALASIGSQTFKSKMSADVAKANAFLSGKGPGTLSGEISATLNPPLGENGKVVPIKVTTPITASTVTKEKVTKINPTTNRKETVEVKKTVKAPLSSVGFTNRRVEITEEFYTSSLPSSADIDIEGFKLIEKGYDLVLKHPPINFIDVDARAYNSDGINFYEYNWSYVAQLQGQHNIRPAFTPPKNVLIMPKELDSNVLNINVITITYEILEKLDPSVKG